MTEDKPDAVEQLIQRVKELEEARAQDREYTAQLEERLAQSEQDREDMLRELIEATRER